MDVEGRKILQYVPFESCVDPTFWHKFTKIKLDVDMLEEKIRPIWGYYSTNYNRILSIDCSSFNKDFSCEANSWKAHGYHLNLNTLEAFRNYDKLKMLGEFGKQIKDCIVSDHVLDDPSILSSFIVLTFADLKKYHFYYWFAYPAPAKPLCYLEELKTDLLQCFSEEQVACIFQCHKELEHEQQNFFGIVIGKTQTYVHRIKDFLNLIEKGDENSSFYWGFVDSCLNPSNPGWPLRNFLLLIYLKCPNLRGETHSVVCLRKKSSSIILKIKFEEGVLESDDKWVGWETNERSKFGPRFVDLSSNMNPAKRAEESVDLNLRLMKWRLVPDLDLTTVKVTRCLLLGAGTLGCSVARSLLAWGVENITFVDSGNISYSNPVRQSLYTFEDCQKETNKAEAAAVALKKIYPAVKSTGVKLTISMPGHGVNDLDSVKVLEQLISEHDAVFLLTDTRESRWLPTLLAAKHNKIAITAALGFDTYLVLRHGVPSSSSRLGCYFCNDVTAPGNSSQDRTLDQQCTVTRPGVSHIAAALAVEMLVSLLQHPNRGGADTSSATCLGEIPHSIRGFLSSHSQIMPSTPAFSQCTACSLKVVEEYSKNGLDFLKEVFLRASYLEELTGLKELHEATTLTEVLEFSDNEEM